MRDDNVAERRERILQAGILYLGCEHVAAISN